MDIGSINPHVRYARVHVALSTSREYSRNYDCRLFFFKTADGTLEVEGEKYKLSNNSVVYLPPASIYKFTFSSATRYEAVVMNFDLVRTYAAQKESLSTATERSFDKQKVPQYELPVEFAKPIVTKAESEGELLWQCADEFMTKRNLYREKASALLKSFLISLLRENAAYGSSKFASSIIDFIKENYWDASLTNEEIALKVGYHPYYLSKLMKRATGRSLKQYLIYYRLQSAKSLLINTDRSMETIAQQTGFGTSAYLIKCFRQHMGTTPLVYRKKNREISF